MPTPRVLLGMTLGALVAAVGALFLGEYEFDEMLPILSGALLGLIVAEVVVSVGRLRSLPLAVMVASWSATAVVLAGYLDSNETEPIKNGAYLSAGLAALAAVARANRWRTRTKDGPRPSAEERDQTGGAAAATAATPAVDPRSPTSGRDARRRPTRAVGDRTGEADEWPELPPTPARAQTRTARRIEPRSQPRPEPQRRSEPQRRPRPEPQQRRRPEPQPRPEPQAQPRRRPDPTQRADRGTPPAPRRRPPGEHDSGPVRVTARRRPRTDRGR